MDLEWKSEIAKVFVRGPGCARRAADGAALMSHGALPQSVKFGCGWCHDDPEILWPQRPVSEDRHLGSLSIG